MMQRVNAPMKTSASIFDARRGLLSGTLLCLVASTAVMAGESSIDIRRFGAKPDGKTLATEAIQKAVDRCAEQGGGTVYLPPGNWLSGTIFLKSHVTLYLEAGCTLIGSTDLAHYPPHRPKIRSYTDNYLNRSLIAGEGLQNVSIRGRGRIYGNGEAFRMKDYMVRPYVIRLVSCRDVLVEGIRMENSPMWMQLYLACDRVVIRGIRVANQCTWNNDGLDIDACRDVCISDCIIDSNDDAICLKSTLDRACENVTISNCVLSSHQTAIKTGTESNGGFKNITISNCVIHAPPVPEKSVYKSKHGGGGISLLLVDGGTLDRITVSNITMHDVDVPICLRLGNRARPFKPDMPTPSMGTFRNVILSNIIATGASKRGCTITGQPQQPIENVLLSNIKLSFAGGGTKKDAEKEVPHLPQSYPSRGMFGVLPSYGFYCRHVDGLVMQNVQLSTEKPDLRPALMCDNVKNLRIAERAAEVSADALTPSGDRISKNK